MEYANYIEALNNLGADIAEFAAGQLGVTRDRETRQTQWKKTGNTWQPIKSTVRKAKGRITATGSLAKSLKHEVDTSGEIPMVQILGNDYGVEINYGRPPTKNGGNGQLFEKIKDWAKNGKKIRVREASSPFGSKFVKDTTASRNAQAFMITRKIHHFGYPARPFMTESVNRTVPKHADELEKALAKDIANEIRSAL